MKDLANRPPPESRRAGSCRPPASSEVPRDDARDRPAARAAPRSRSGRRSSTGCYFTDDVLGADQRHPRPRPGAVRGTGRRRSSSGSTSTSPRPGPTSASRSSASFAKAHADRIELAGNVQVVAGGEAVKNDIHILERMLKVFHAAGPRPAELRRGHRRRRGARRRRVRRGDRPPGHPAGPPADHHARPRPTRAWASRTASTSSARRTGSARSPSPGRSSTTPRLLATPARPRLHLRLLRGGEGLAPEGPGDVRRRSAGRPRRSAAATCRPPCR